jgi:hypothetical protein
MLLLLSVHKCVSVVVVLLHARPTALDLELRHWRPFNGAQADSHDAHCLSEHGRNYSTMSVPFTSG